MLTTDKSRWWLYRYSSCYSFNFSIGFKFFKLRQYILRTMISNWPEVNFTCCKSCSRPNVHVACSVASVVSNSVGPHGLQPARLLYSWDFPCKNTGVDCFALLQGIFLTQGLNLGLGGGGHICTIVWSEAKLQGGSTAPPISRKLD